MRRVRHKKRGAEYEVIGTGRIQSDSWVEYDEDRSVMTGLEEYSEVDMAEVVIYRSVTDPTEIWVRPVEEFNDGRFEDVGQ